MRDQVEEYVETFLTTQQNGSHEDCVWGKGRSWCREAGTKQVVRAQGQRGEQKLEHGLRSELAERWWGDFWRQGDNLPSCGGHLSKRAKMMWTKLNGGSQQHVGCIAWKLCKGSDRSSKASPCGPGNSSRRPSTGQSVKMLALAPFSMKTLQWRHHENQHKILPGLVIIFQPPDKLDLLGTSE